MGRSAARTTPTPRATPRQADPGPDGGRTVGAGKKSERGERRCPRPAGRASTGQASGGARSGQRQPEASGSNIPQSLLGGNSCCPLPAPHPYADRPALAGLLERTGTTWPRKKCTTWPPWPSLRATARWRQAADGDRKGRSQHRNEIASTVLAETTQVKAFTALTHVVLSESGRNGAPEPRGRPRALPRNPLHTAGGVARCGAVRCGRSLFHTSALL